MDHVIVTNFEGHIALYRGPELTTLIWEVLETEFDLTPFEMANPDSEFEPTLTEAIRNPSITALADALAYLDIDMFHSGPQE